MRFCGRSEHSSGSGAFTGHPGSVPPNRTAETSARESFFERPVATRTSIRGSLTATLALSRVAVESGLVESGRVESGLAESVRDESAVAARAGLVESPPPAMLESRVAASCD